MVRPLLRKSIKALEYLQTCSPSKQVTVYLNKSRLYLRGIHNIIQGPDLGTLEWWISGLMLNPISLLISRLTKSRDYVSLEIKYLDHQI